MTRLETYGIAIYAMYIYLAMDYDAHAHEQRINHQTLSVPVLMC